MPIYESLPPIGYLLLPAIRVTEIWNHSITAIQAITFFLVYLTRQSVARILSGRANDKQYTGNYLEESGHGTN
jgi:hypothetical protein